MHVTSTVTYEAGPQATNKATFFLADEMDVPKVRILAPEALAGEVVPTSVSKRDHDVTYELQLPKSIEAGQRLKVMFEYSSKVSKGFVYLLSPTECLAGGYNTCWFPSVGQSRRMFGSLEFDSPAGYIVKASGKEQSATETGGRRITKFFLQQPIVPTFAAAAFKVTHVAGAVPMTLYLLRDRPVANDYAEGCSKILGVLTREYGPYPFPDFSIIETPSPESSNELGFSGASFEGFMFADSNSVDSGFNLAYFGHEIGHQWWGNLVQLSGPKGAYMLSEAMAQYGSLQCVSAIGGPELAARYRFHGYPGYSDLQCGYGAILYMGTEADRPLSQLPAGYDVVYHQLANAKGFLTWDTIARQIGRDRFRKALHAVTSKYAWGTVTFDQFLDEVRAAGPSNVDAILSQWLDRKGMPVIGSNWKQIGNNLEVTLQQTSPPYVLRIPVVIESEDGSRAAKLLDLSTESTTYKIGVHGRVAAVQVDPNHEVLHATPELMEESTQLRPSTEAMFARFRGKSDEAEAKLTDGLKNLPKPDSHGVEYVLESALADVYWRAKKYQEARVHYEAAIRCPIRRPNGLPWTYFRLAQVLRQLGDTAASEAALRNTESADAAISGASGVAAKIVQFRAERK